MATSTHTCAHTTPITSPNPMCAYIRLHARFSVANQAHRRYDASGKRKRKHSTANEDDESGEEDTKLMESVKTLSELLTGDERGITSISAELAAAIAEAQRAPAHPPTIYEVEDEHEQAPPDKDPVPLYTNPKEKGGRGARRRARRPAATSNPDDDGDGEDDEEDDVNAGAFIPTPLRTRRTTISTADR